MSNLEVILCRINAQVILKGTKTLKAILMHPKEKMTLHLKQKYSLQMTIVRIQSTSSVLKKVAINLTLVNSADVSKIKGKNITAI